MCQGCVNVQPRTGHRRAGRRPTGARSGDCGAAPVLEDQRPRARSCNTACLSHHETEMSTSWWAPMAMLFLSPALTSVARSRSSSALLRLLGADLIAIVVGIKVIEPGDVRWIWIFYMTALAALLLTGALLGGVVRFGIDHGYAR